MAAREPFHIPAGTLEFFEPTEELRVLVTCTPGGIDKFFAQAGDPAHSPSLPPAPEGPPGSGDGAAAVRAGERDVERIAVAVPQDPLRMPREAARASMDGVRIVVRPTVPIPARLVVEVQRVHGHPPHVPAQERTVRSVPALGVAVQTRSPRFARSERRPGRRRPSRCGLAARRLVSGAARRSRPASAALRARPAKGLPLTARDLILRRDRVPTQQRAAPRARRCPAGGRETRWSPRQFCQDQRRLRPSRDLPRACEPTRTAARNY
jgi:hypothetical protein